LNHKSKSNIMFRDWQQRICQWVPLALRH
jgi:hypothetical protein